MKKFAVVLLLMACVAGLIYFVNRSLQLKREVALLRNQPRMTDEAGTALAFMQDFISNVVGAGKEVDFETRLRLENEVRALNDSEILSQWKAFTASKNEQDAQAHVIIILQRLITLIRN